MLENRAMLYAHIINDITCFLKKNCHLHCYKLRFETINQLCHDIICFQYYIIPHARILITTSTIIFSDFYHMVLHNVVTPFVYILVKIYRNV